MKNRKVAVALGLCLAVGLCGAGLAACGDDTTDGGKGGNKGAIDISSLTISDTQSDYYLAGDSKSELFSGALGTWQSTGKKGAVPDKIALKTTNKANIYAINVDLFEGDEFQILVVDQEWTGQMGAAVIVPEVKEGDDISGAGGIVNANMHVNRDGNYTIALQIDSKTKKVSYVREGDATPFATQYNYWVMGENISGGEAKYNTLTSFTTDKNRTVYTNTVNLEANEKISILEAAVNAGNNGANITAATLAQGAAISAIPAAQAEEGEEAGEGEGEGEEEAPKAPVYQYQAGEAGAYTITITETDALNTETNKMETTRVISATKAETINYKVKLKSTSYGDQFQDQYEWDFALVDGKYEFTFEGVATEPDAPTSGMVIPADGVKIAVGKVFSVNVVKEGTTATEDEGRKVLYTLTAKNGFTAAWDEMTYGIDHSTNTVKEVGTYKITVDPVTFDTTITREDEEQNAYRVYAHGSYSGAGWADHATSVLAPVGGEASKTVDLTLTLAEGDEFGIRTYHASNYGKDGDQLTWASADKVATLPEQIKGADEGGTTGNFKVVTAGTFTLHITVKADGTVEAIAIDYAAPQA